MKIKEIRQMSTNELRIKIGELKESLFNLRFQHGSGQLENPGKIGQTKKEIARCHTILAELEKQTDKG